MVACLPRKVQLGASSSFTMKDESWSIYKYCKLTLPRENKTPRDSDSFDCHGPDLALEAEGGSRSLSIICGPGWLRRTYYVLYNRRISSAFLGCRCLPLSRLYKYFWSTSLAIGSLVIGSRGHGPTGSLGEVLACPTICGHSIVWRPPLGKRITGVTDRLQ